MAAWLIPALKAVAPHIGTIISAAGPVFTKKRMDAAAGQTGVLQQQITELQEAASQNTAYIKDLAAQLQNTIAVLEKAAATAESRLRLMYTFCIVAVVLSIAALAVALYVLFSLP